MSETPSDSVVLSPLEAAELISRALAALRVPAADIPVAAEHFLAVELRGRGGFERVLGLEGAVGDDGSVEGQGLERIQVEHIDAVFARCDGGNHIGHVVAARATETAIEKASENGIAVVVANRHKWTGSLGYYAELAANEGLVAIVMASGACLVAPFGGAERRIGANPLALGFPSAGEPVIWDIATSAISGVALQGLIRDGRALPEGVAVDIDGVPTTDPLAAIKGAILTWGGHRGGGLAVAIQMMTLLSGMPVDQRDADGWGFLIMLIDPGMFLPEAVFRARVTEFAKIVRSSRPAAGFDGVRLPGDRSSETRRRQLATGIVVPRSTYERIAALAAGSGPILGVAPRNR